MKMFLGALVGWMMIATVSGQAPTTTPSPAGPDLDELDRAVLQTVFVAQKRANDACVGLDAVKEFNSLRTSTQARIETRHPGFTVKWDTYTLTPKGPTADPTPTAKGKP